MLVAVRTPRIEFEVKGTTVPDDVIDFFRKKFGDKNVSVDDEEYILAEDMPEFRQFKAEETPGKTIRFYRKMMGLTQAQLDALEQWYPGKPSYASSGHRYATRRRTDSGTRRARGGSGTSGKNTGKEQTT